MRHFLAVALLVVLPLSASAAYFDDFESYTDTASMMQTGNWGDDGANTAPVAPAVWDALGGAFGVSAGMTHPGGKTAKHVIAPLVASDAQPIVWEFDIIDDGASANKRVTGGLRDNGAGATLNALLEMGHYNAFTTGGGYGVRVLGLSTNIYGNPGWVKFAGVAVTAGTHHLKAVLGETYATFTIDLLADGSVDDTLNFAGSGQSLAWNVLRLGGPSDLSSAGGALGFDNVGIMQIPEPAAFLLLALGALLRRR